jgi:hypothetical protein
MMKPKRGGFACQGKILEKSVRVCWADRKPTDEKESCRHVVREWRSGQEAKISRLRMVSAR